MIRFIVVLFFSSFFIVGCGMSDQQKSDVALATCSIISESNALDSVLRVKEVNTAREKIGEPPYVEGDSGIVESLHWGLCEELVLNDLSYETKLQSKMNEFVTESEREEERQRLEDKRILEEKISQLEEKYSLSCPKSEEEEEVFLGKVENLRINSIDENFYGEIKLLINLCAQTSYRSFTNKEV